jgi:hypothetical protein
MHVSTVPSAWATSMLALTIPAVSKPVAAVKTAKRRIPRIIKMPLHVA